MTQKNGTQNKSRNSGRKAGTDPVETEATAAHGAEDAPLTARVADSVADLAEEMARDNDGMAGFADDAEETLRDAHAGYNLESIMRIPVSIQVVLGSASMPVANLMKLGRGAVVPLDHRVGEPVDVVVNGRVVARGEVVVVEDDNSRFGVSLTEIVTAQSGGVGF